MQKGFWLIIVGVVVLMFGLFALKDEEATTNTISEYDPTTLQLTDHIKSLASKPTTVDELAELIEGKVVIIEYGDFQCPACGVFFPVLKQLELDFEDSLVIAFRNFPLTQIHPDAMAAHRAAEAAALQDKFFEMHDLIYQRQNSWVGSGNVNNAMESYAIELGLDVEKFKTDSQSTEVFDRISVDIDSSGSLGVASTPTIILDGTKVTEPPTYENLSALIHSKLASL